MAHRGLIGAFYRHVLHIFGWVFNSTGREICPDFLNMSGNVGIGAFPGAMCVRIGTYPWTWPGCACA